MSIVIRIAVIRNLR